MQDFPRIAVRQASQGWHVLRQLAVHTVAVYAERAIIVLALGGIALRLFRRTVNICVHIDLPLGHEQCDRVHGGGIHLAGKTVHAVVEHGDDLGGIAAVVFPQTGNAGLIGAG